MQSVDTLRTRLRWVLFTLSVLCLVVLFGPALRFSASMFADSHEDLSHGWLIPVVSGYAIWRLRRRLAVAAASPAWSGVGALAFCLVLFWLGNRGEQARLMQIGMIGCVAALPWAFWGRHVARLLLFPTAYLFFILPTSFLDGVTFPLRLLSAWLASGVMNGLGVPVQQIGTAMLSTAGKGFQLDVADPCSGMRSIFALAALTAAYAWFTQKTLLRRWLLFACAVPLAILGNIVRLASTGLVGYFWGQTTAARYHDGWGGYPGFILAVLIMIQAGVWIQRIGRTPAAAAPPAGAPPPDLRPWRWSPLAVSLLAALACYAVVRWTPPPAVESDAYIAAEMPERVDGFAGQTTWFCQNKACLALFNERDLPAFRVGAKPVCPRCGQPMERVSLAERQILPADTRILKRTYLGADGLQFALTVVVSGQSRLSIHRPEMCLPGQGFNIQSSRVVPLDLGGGRILRVNVVKAARTGERPIGFLYWFVNPRRTTPSHWTRIFSDVWERTVHNRINRWSMVTVFGDFSGDDPEQLRTVERFVAAWYPQLLVRQPEPRTGGAVPSP